MSDQILWLDLETAGVDIAADSILEVGLLVTDAIEGEVAALSVPIRPYGFNPLNLSGDVYDMHSKSGLLDDLRSDGCLPAEASDRIRAFLSQHLALFPGYTLGGSGIDRFDLPFLRNSGHLAFLAGNALWRTVDVSTTKQIMKQAGYPVPVVETAHRAVDDARWAYKVYLAALDAFASVEVPGR